MISWQWLCYHTRTHTHTCSHTHTMTDTHMLVCKSGMLSVCTVCVLYVYIYRQEALSCGSVESPGVEELAARSPFSLSTTSISPPSLSLQDQPVHFLAALFITWLMRIPKDEAIVLAFQLGLLETLWHQKHHHAKKEKELHLQSQNTLHLSATN